MRRWRYGRHHIGQWTIRRENYRGSRLDASSHFLREQRFYPCCRDIRTIKIKRRWGR